MTNNQMLENMQRYTAYVNSKATPADRRAIKIANKTPKQLLNWIKDCEEEMDGYIEEIEGAGRAISDIENNVDDAERGMTELKKEIEEYKDNLEMLKEENEELKEHKRWTETKELLQKRERNDEIRRMSNSR